jgi:signal transduction histidine kinase
MSPDHDDGDEGGRDAPSHADPNDPSGDAQRLASRRVEERMDEAERRMADAEALLEIASAQLSVAARNIANANAAEREYRRAVWHYTQLMKHRISNPLQTIIGMADTLRDMPDLEQSRRQAMIEAIGQQARVLRDVSLEPRVQAENERILRPEPLDAAVRMHAVRGGDAKLHAVRDAIDPKIETTKLEPEPIATDEERPTKSRSPFTRFRRNEADHRDDD